MRPVDGERLRETLGQPALVRLVERIHRRLSRGSGSKGFIALKNPTVAEREALGKLLGKHLLPARQLRVSLDQLHEMLSHAQICSGLEAAVINLLGPLEDPRATRRRVARAWRRLFADARLKDAREPVHIWLDDLEVRGLLRRLAEDIGEAETLLCQVMTLAAWLPADGMLLKELAARVLGDAHGLDEGRRLTTLLASLAVALTDSDRPEGMGQRRALWNSVGLIPDELSVSILVFGLRALPDTLCGRVLNQYCDAGEPCRLTLRQLQNDMPRFPGAARLFVCENPAVVQAAAMRVPAGGPPLLSLDGQPNTAARLLLDSLAESGYQIHYHGDFDWPGIAIANLMVRDQGARPWRMSATDYSRAPASLPLKGEPVTPIWEEALGFVMQQRGLAIHEEAVLDELLLDLAPGR